ncbi:MAG: response regulator [Spirochaetales bacterium]|nr:response regulator [Spirochaetales bacterium]
MKKEDCKVLVVDDNQDFAEAMADVLELNGYSVDRVFDGEDAIRKFRKTDYDFVFIDVKLPGINGYESYLEIRKIKPMAKVVMMTGYSVKQLLQQAMQNGVMEILYKPFDMSKALDLLQQTDPSVNGEPTAP